jgi:hypothetical protein
VGSRRIDNVWQERKRANPDFGKKDQIAAYEEVCSLASKRYSNFDPDEKQLCVIVWENAVARIPLSCELFTGPYDEQWGYKDGHQVRMFQGARLAELSQQM